MDPECKVKLAEFEGPLDLLLYLINKNRLEITDIPIALVTRQYLEYLEIMQALNVVVAGEYLVMAATLMHIKSKILLPAPEAEELEDDPRLEIVEPLKELAAARAFAKEVERMPLLGRDVFFRGLATNHSVNNSTKKETDENSSPLEVTLDDLVDALVSVLSRQSRDSSLKISRQEISLDERIDFVLSVLNSSGGRTSFFDLFHDNDRQIIIITFLAILELAKQSYALIFQKLPGDEIFIMKRGG